MNSQGKGHTPHTRQQVKLARQVQNGSLWCTMALGAAGLGKGSTVAGSGGKKCKGLKLREGFTEGLDGRIG